MSSSPSPSDFVGYGSYNILGRICLPDLVVLQKAFSSYSTSLAGSINQSYLSKFITDIQNVFFWKIFLELAIYFSRIWICYRYSIYLNVFHEMDRTFASLAINSWNYYNLCRSRIYLPLQCRNIPIIRSSIWKFRHPHIKSE